MIKNGHFLIDIFQHFLSFVLCCSIIFMAGCSTIKENNESIFIERDSNVIEINKFNNEDERVPIDPDKYGKNTPEEVFVEFIQAICGDDSERLMHTLPPFLLDYILADDTDTENYQQLIECFTDYELHNWGILSRKYDVWECCTEKIEQCGEAELQALNAEWHELYPDYYIEIPEITDAINIYSVIKIQYEKEEYEEQFGVQIYQINEKWYINIYCVG